MGSLSGDNRKSRREVSDERSCALPDGDIFETFVDDLARLLDPTDIEYVAGIDAMRYIPGTALARRFDVGFWRDTEGPETPDSRRTPDRRRSRRLHVEEKTLEVDIQQVPTDRPILIVDNWMETASQVQTTIDLIELPDGEVGGIAY